MSSRELGQLVTVRPSMIPADTGSPVPWQITAIGFFALLAARTKACARGSRRIASPLSTPPGSTSAS